VFYVIVTTRGSPIGSRIPFLPGNKTANATIARQAEKEALESHSQKQGKASTFGPATAPQNKANSSPVASSAKSSSSKLPSSLAPKKQPNTL